MLKKKTKKSEVEFLEEEKKKTKFHLFTIIIIFIVSLCSLISGYVIERIVNYKNIEVDVDYNVISTRKEYNASLVMVGDALFHEAVYYAGRSGNGYDFSRMFEKVAPIVEKYDLAYYNQETILGGKEIGLSTYPQFNSPYEVGDGLTKIGFNLVSLANNHSMDTYYYKGGKAQSNSFNYWNNKKDSVLATGAFSSFEERNRVDIREVNGISYTLLSYTTSTNGIGLPSGKEYLVNVYSEERVKEDIEKYRGKVDIIMVAMHWGSEYTHNPTTQQVNIANFLANEGVDIIIGTHPHVIQPVTFIGDTLVVYSLGNFVSAQQGIERLTGLMLGLNIKKVVHKGVTTISYEDIKGELIYTNRGDRYRVYPYGELNDSILYGYKNYYQKYAGIVTSMSDRVSMMGVK